MDMHPRFVAAPPADMPAGNGPTLPQIRADRAADDVEARAVPRAPAEAAVTTLDAMVAGVPVRWYFPEEDAARAGGATATAPSSAHAAGPRPLVVYLHGGGWVFGSVDTVDHLCRRLVLRTRGPVASVAYRLAPEHPWPAPVDDVDAAMAALASGVDVPAGVDGTARRTVVAGDSAGGWLAAMAARRARVAGLGLGGQVLVYPVVTRSALAGRPADEAADADFTVAEMEWFWDQLLGREDDAATATRTGTGAATGMGSAVRAEVADGEIGWPDDLAGLPPALVLLAEHDVLRPEGHALADALQAAGVDVVATQFHGVHHGFFRHSTVFTASRVAIDQVASWAVDVVAAAG